MSAPAPITSTSSTSGAPATTLTLVSPRPISDSLQQHLDDVLARIPSGKRARIDLGVSNTGAEVSVGAKTTFKGAEIVGQGYAGKVWGGKGYDAGARASILF